MMTSKHVTPQPAAITGQLPTAAPSVPPEAQERMVSPCEPMFPPFSQNYQLDTEIVCPCCHEVSMEKAYQEAMVPKPGKMGYWQYHCRNPKCAGYGRTLPLEQFTATYGTAMTQEANDED